MDRLTAKLVNRLTAMLVNRLTAKLVVVNLVKLHLTKYITASLFFELSLDRSYFLGCSRLEMFLRMFLNFNNGNPTTSELHIDLKTGSSL